ncbi:hypothetical protein D3C78_1359850 [compost metagenome]
MYFIKVNRLQEVLEMGNNREERSSNSGGCGCGCNGQPNGSGGSRGEGRSGRLSMVKNHKTGGMDVPNEFISGTDKYRG